MKVKNSGWLLMLITFLVVACGPASLSPDSYREWLRDPNNGLVEVKNVGVYSFELEYLPLEYMAWKQNPRISSQELGEAVSELEGLDYYQLTISAVGGSLDPAKLAGDDQERQQFSKQYFNFGLEHDVWVEDVNGKSACKLFIAESEKPGFNKRIVLLAFDSCKPEESQTVVIDSEELNTGKMKFLIAHNELPKLKI